MNIRKKIILIIAGLPIVIVSLFFIWRFLSMVLGAGSYPLAEVYEYKAPEVDVITAVNKFKHEHPEYNPPKSIGLEDGRSDSTDHWYHVYIYYKDKNQLVHFCIRPDYYLAVTTLSLVNINDGLVLGNWYQVNSGYDYFKDRKIKKEFENRVLSEIEKNIK